MSSIDQIRIRWAVLAVISLASFTNGSLQATPVVVRRSLPIHGPFDVNSAELTATDTSSGTSAIPIPPVEEKKTDLLHFLVQGSHTLDHMGPPGSPGGHPSQVPTFGSKKYTPDSGWVIDTSRGKGGYSIVVNTRMEVIQ